MGYLQQNGLFKVGPDAYDKWNTRINLTAKLSDKITMDVRMGYIKEGFDRSSKGVENGGSLSTAFSAVRNSQYLLPMVNFMERRVVRVT
jgi:hypothetical protein